MSYSMDLVTFWFSSAFLFIVAFGCVLELELICVFLLLRPWLNLGLKDHRVVMAL